MGRQLSGPDRDRCVPTSESVAIAILLSLMAALLVIMGSPLSLKSPAVVEEDAVDALALRVKRVAVQCGLSPREQEVLAIWQPATRRLYRETAVHLQEHREDPPQPHLCENEDR